MRQIATSLIVWFTVVFVITFFAHDLSMHLFNSDQTSAYQVGTQGVPIVYVLITMLYARCTNRAADTVAEHEEVVQRDTSKPTQSPSI